MPRACFISLFILATLLTTVEAWTQQPEHEHHENTTPASPQGTMPAQHEHSPSHGTAMRTNEAGNFLMRQASGTGINPVSAETPMLMTEAGSWNLMFHSSIFVSDIQQKGPRGADKFLSTNWFMGMAERPVGSGSVMVRSMISLDPLTVTKRRYPELFQTGELAFGKPIIDAQHPHDLLMEFAVQYARQLSERSMFNLYFAPVGDPALGPVAFPHRISAEALPQATLGHHLQDSTHIANEVLTAGIEHGMFRLETSGFHGREPNENRWNIDYGAIDSWSTRFVVSPGHNWNGQVSVGRLHEPEPLEDGDIVRSTASVSYNRPLLDGLWTTSLIWGRNHQTETKQNLNSYLAESLVRFSSANYVSGRIELVDKNELFIEDHGSDHSKIYRVAAYTLGYTRGLRSVKGLQAALGTSLSLYTLPRELHKFYGEKPASLTIFFRFRPQM